MSKLLDPQFQEILRRYSYLRKRIALNNVTLTPTNYLDEKRRFFSQTNYDPQYEYQFTAPRISELEIVELQKNTEQLNLPEDLKTYVISCIDEFIRYFRVRNTVGQPEYIANISSLMPTLDIAELEPELKTHICQTDPGQLINAEEIKLVFEQKLHDYHINQYPVTIDNRSPDIIRVSKSKIIIGSNVRRTLLDVDRLIVHEIESHLFQNLNHQPDAYILDIISYHDQHLYTEGLAVYNETACGLLTPRSFSNYYYRYQAAKLNALSFHEIYLYLIDQQVPQDQAFDIVYRLKRGMADTSQPGGLLKDSLYILGYQFIKKHLQKGGSITELYIYRSPQLAELSNKYQLLNPATIYIPNLYPLDSPIQGPLFNTK